MSKRTGGQADFVFVNFEFTIKRLTIQLPGPACVDPDAQYCVHWRQKKKGGQTDWQHLEKVGAIPTMDKSKSHQVLKAKWGEHGRGHQETVPNLHLPVKAETKDAEQQSNKILEIKLYMRRSGDAGEGEQIGRTVRWKLELNRDDAGGEGKPAKKKTGTLDIGPKENTKGMQINVSFQMQEVPPDVAQQLQAERKASKKGDRSAVSGMTTDHSASGVDSDANALQAERTARANARDREREEREQQTRERAEDKKPPDPDRAFAHEPDTDGGFPPAPEQEQWGEVAPARGVPSGRHRGTPHHGEVDAYSQDPSAMPGNSVDVDKMKYQVLKLYHKLSEQGGQLEEKRRDLRQMHRLYVELKRDFEAAQEELDRREMHIGELQDQLCNERQDILRQLHTESETIQRRSRSVDHSVYTQHQNSREAAQRRNCDCSIL